mgnify:CR=1 FL=1
MTSIEHRHDHHMYETEAHVNTCMGPHVVLFGPHVICEVRNSHKHMGTKSGVLTYAYKLLFFKMSV